MPATLPRQEIAEAIEANLEHEAQRNEMRVGRVRSFAYGAVAVIDGALVLFQLRTPADLALSTSLFVISLGMFWMTRWRYDPSFRFLLPVLDAMLIYAILSQRIADRGFDSGLSGATVGAASLFAATGGIRFDRRAALWTTVLAIALLIALTRRPEDPAALLYQVVAIASVGLLNLWLSDLVRRSMEGARSRLLLTRFLPRGLVEGAFADPLAVLAEPRELTATVLVSDLRGFTAFAQKLKPAEVLGFLNELQGELAAAVEEQGGVVDKFMGDGMLAVFGAPDEVSDHALRALNAVASIRSRVAKLSAQRGRTIGVGIGVHTGSLVVGLLGSGSRLELTVIGDTVNTASRLEALTKELAVDVLVSAETARSAGVELIPRGAVEMRGRTGTVDVFTVPGA